MSAARKQQLRWIAHNAPILHHQPTKAREFDVDLELLVTKSEIDNYRERTLTDCAEMIASFEEYGQLEPGKYSVQENHDWKLLDGEGRLISAVATNQPIYKTIIYENLTPLQEAEIQLASNAFKMAFEPWAESQAIAEVYSLIDPQGYSKQRYNTQSLKRVGKLAGVKPATIRNYLQFETLPKDIKNWVRKDEGVSNFSRAIQIAKKIPTAHEQQEIFYEVRRRSQQASKLSKELRSLKAQKNNGTARRIYDLEKEIDSLHLSDKKFRQLLEPEKNFAMHVSTTQQRQNQDHVKLRDSTKQAKAFTKSLYSIESLAPKRFNELTQTTIRHALFDSPHTLTYVLRQANTELDERIKHLPESKQEKIMQIQFDNKEISLAKKLLGDYLRKDSYQSFGKIHMIDKNTIMSAENNARQVYDEKVIQALATSIESIGQLDPGLIHPAKNPNYQWEVVFGSTRHKGVMKTPLKHYKTYKLEERLSDQEVQLLQLIENIHRRDSLKDRAHGMHKKFIAEQELRGEQYSIKDFIEDNKDYADPTSIKKYLQLANLDERVQPFFDSAYLSGTQALLINEALPRFNGHTQQADEMLLRVLIHKPKTSKLPSMIDKTIDSLSNHNLFEIEPSYQRLATETANTLYEPIKRLETITDPNNITPATVKHIAEYKRNLSLLAEASE